ncbi:hypothetical protein GAYE_PCTG32G0839 [Galdieria yellowstonensis]|uniref:Uncharacterized protein n=1 Tax=Galdieria yellowstonensis TaxID=3028027 RepID=A0AAV9I6F2_9RHOD|nr:hypothetical protein GAYE_PCTG32G0839 [Galdieria yellowstonensis]
MFRECEKTICWSRSVGTCLLAVVVVASTLYPKVFHKRVNSSSFQFSFVFSCGRAGTKHFSKVFGDNNSFVTHQLECNDKPTRELIADFYRPMLQNGSFIQLEQYVINQLIPFMESNLRATGTTKYFYTGHVPFTFGLADYLLRHIKTPVKIIRVRRSRIPLALSLLNMGPEEEDPWVNANNVSKYKKRWLLTPTDPVVKLPCPPLVWNRLNRFQKYLWVVDDTECRWQYLKRRYHFDYLELQLEALDQIHGMLEYEKISNFLGIGFENKSRKLFYKHNSKEILKHPLTLCFPESQLRAWDEEYKRMIGSCQVHSEQKKIGWNL